MYPYGAAYIFGEIVGELSSAAWKKVCPTANFLLHYTKKETYSAMTEGQEDARELSASNYGRDEWWVLLEPVSRRTRLVSMSAGLECRVSVRRVKRKNLQFPRFGNWLAVVSVS